MKKLFTALVLGALSISNVAFAQTVAILDAQRAIQESKVATTVKADIEKLVAEDQKKIESIQASIKALVEKLQKDQLILGEEESYKLKSDIKALEDEGKFIQSRAQKTVREHEEMFFRKVGPKVEEIAKNIAKTEGYDLVLPRAAVLYFDPKFDITSKVIKELNKSGI